MQKQREKLTHLMHALRHPPVERVTRIVLVTHIFYYGAAVISPFIAGHSVLHYATSGACFVALVAELFSHKE